MNMEMAAEKKNREYDSTSFARTSLEQRCDKCSKEKAALQHVAVKSAPEVVPPIDGLGNPSIAGKVPRFVHDFSQIPAYSKSLTSIQAKPTAVDTPGDIYEQEADRIADQVMAVPRRVASGPSPLIQRLSEQPVGQMEAVPASVDRVLASPGSPLEPVLLQDMDQRVGHDFSRIRVHTGVAAEQSAKDVNAHAYTVKNDIVFGANQFAPGTHEGRRLIAHELVHVVQQTEKGEPRFSTSSLIQRQSGKENERQIRVLKKRADATALDLLWRGRFGTRLSSYRQAILRITSCLDDATAGFQSAQMSQAQTDALKWQIIGGVGSVLFAGVFEWVVGGMLGKLGVSLARTEKIVEKLENPVNALISATVNIKGAATSKESAERGKTPGIQTPGQAGAGGAMAYLTRSLGNLEQHTELIENAFVSRSEKLQGYTDEDWLGLDPAAQGTIYQALYDDMNKTSAGIDMMKEPQEVSLVLERHLWALWIRNSLEGLLIRHNANIEGARGSGTGPIPEFGEYKPEEELKIGTDIEDRLNTLRISAMADVTLTGHWYSSNSKNWEMKLSSWARSYSETIRK